MLYSLVTLAVEYDPYPFSYSHRMIERPIGKKGCHKCVTNIRLRVLLYRQ